MRIFLDYHHGGAARGQYLLLAHRLGHEVWFPDEKMVDWADAIHPGAWMRCLPSFAKSIGGMPYADGEFPWRICSFEQFRSMTWDMILVTRPESVPIARKMVEGLSPQPKIVGMTGNDCTDFDWTFVKNFMSTDFLSYMRNKSLVHSIHYSQELGWDFHKPFVTIKAEHLRVVNSFINCLPTFNGSWEWECEYSGWRGHCPHCDSTSRPEHKPVRVYDDIWQRAKAMLPEVTFRDFGIACSYGFVPEPSMPMEYDRSSLTWHMKTYDGYGFSMLQSIARGRPVIVPYRFHKYRTAGRYLIPGLTCFEVDWTPEATVEVVKYVTANLQRANDYAAACYNAASGLFHWEHEARRVGEFLEDLR